MPSIAAILAVASLTVLGPGALAPADPLVLERVEVRRVLNGWGLDEFAPPGVVRLAVEDCRHLGRDGLILVDDTAHPARVVDCCAEAGCLSERGLVADVSRPDLGHKEATIILWQMDHP